MWNLAHIAAALHLWTLDEDVTYFPRVLRANSDTKLWSDEGVVDEVGHILKWLPVVLTGREMFASKIKCLSNTKCARFLTGEIIGLTFDRVWTARVLSWRRAPEKWSKPGWPAEKEGSAWIKEEHLSMYMKTWCEGPHCVVCRALCKKTAHHFYTVQWIISTARET